MTKTQKELKEKGEEYGATNSNSKELSEDALKKVNGGTDNMWIYEKSYDDYQKGCNTGSIQEMIGDWSNEEHSR